MLPVKRDLRDGRVGRPLGSYERSEAHAPERVEHAADEELPVEGHRQRAAESAAAEERMGPVARAIAKVELEKVVTETFEADHTEVRLPGGRGGVIDGQILEKIGLTGHELLDQR